jgi:prophage DNA circulation protein
MIQVGAIATYGSAQLNGGGLTFWQSLAACFDAARAAGASFEAMDKIRLIADSQTPQYFAGIAVKNFSIRMALAEQALILAATTFASRQDIDKYFDLINVSFDEAEVVAANNFDNTSYKALIAIHAAVSNDLASRSRPLPRMVSISFAKRMPALWLAQRIYADATRSDELIGENRPIHPLFMPQAIVALSS